MSTRSRSAKQNQSAEGALASDYSLPTYPFVKPLALTTGEVTHHPIVIVGAGLTGLTLACKLAQLHIPAVLLDEDNTVGVKGASSRGICYTQQSLEIFQRLGIYEQVAAKGVAWQVGRTFAGDEEVYSFDLRDNKQFSLSQQPPFINIQQFYIEMWLVDRIHALNQAGGSLKTGASIDLRWCSKVVDFQQNKHGATLFISTPEGDYALEASHVIDATGSHSPFHAWCEVSMDSKKGDDRWCIADVRFQDNPPTERHTWIEAPFNDNRAVWQHLMADDVWRIDYQMAPDADPDYVSRKEVVHERLAKQFGKQVPCEIVWVGPYAYKSQCLHQLRAGRVFFMGDTAKVVSPFGARGGNTGIADADNLGWKLAAVMRGDAPEQLLDSYHQERWQAAQRNLQVTNRTARYLRPPTQLERLFRDATIGLAKQHAFARPLINTGRMAEANRYTASDICHTDGGWMVQNVALQFDDALTGSLNDLLCWAGGHLLLLVFGSLKRGEIKKLAMLSNTTPVRVVQVMQQENTQVRERVLDPHKRLRKACDAIQHRWALLRPDAYLASRGKHIDGKINKAISQSLGLHSPGTPHDHHTEN